MALSSENHFQQRIEPLGKRPAEAPEVETGWERYQGRRIKRQLWRTAEPAGWNGWDHLRQVWLVRQLTQHKDARVADLRSSLGSAPISLTRVGSSLYDHVDSPDFWTVGVADGLCLLRT